MKRIRKALSRIFRVISIVPIIVIAIVIGSIEQIVFWVLKILDVLQMCIQYLSGVDKIKPLTNWGQSDSSTNTILPISFIFAWDKFCDWIEGEYK